jgi:hypothetical protein
MITTRQMHAMIHALEPGQGKWIKLPGEQPHNRNAYLRLNGVAYGLWGKGGYRMRSMKGEIGVFRRERAPDVAHALHRNPDAALQVA